MCRRDQIRYSSFTSDFFDLEVSENVKPVKKSLCAPSEMPDLGPQMTSVKIKIRSLTTCKVTHSISDFLSGAVVKIPPVVLARGLTIP